MDGRPALALPSKARGSQGAEPMHSPPVGSTPGTLKVMPRPPNVNVCCPCASPPLGEQLATPPPEQSAVQPTPGLTALARQKCASTTCCIGFVTVQVAV